MNAASTDRIWVLESDWLWDLDVDHATNQATPSNQRTFRPPSPGFGAFYVDRAYDGNWWGFVTSPATGLAAWGRIDPDAVSDGTNIPGMIPNGRFPYDPEGNGSYINNPPAFLREVPDPGAPIGYRLAGPPPPNPVISGLTQGGGFGQGGLDLYAVESLNPYREHLVSAGIQPRRFNFGVGNVVYVAPGAGSQEARTQVLFVTTDAVYSCPGLGCASVTQVGFLSLYGISRLAVTSGSSQPNLLYVADGGELFDYDILTGDVMVRLVPPLFQIVGLSHYGSRRGGVAFTPDTRIVTSESGGNWTVTVALTHPPTADVTMTLSSSNLAEGTVAPASVTFTPANWMVPQTVTVTAVPDTAVDGPQDYVIVTGDLVSTDLNYSGMVIRDMAATNHDGGGPSLTVRPIAARPGSMFTAHLADVSDLEDSPGALAVDFLPNRQLILGAPVNTNGAVTAPLTAPCTMASGYSLFWPIEVVDSAGNRRSDRVEVVMNPVAAPVLAYPNQTLTAGSSAAIAPTAYDGSASLITVNAPTFGGTIAADAATGHLAITNAGPAGDHIVELTASQRCDGALTTTTSFTLHVNEPPSLTPAAPVVRQGTLISSALLANVLDPETPAGSLTVTPISIPSGITLGTLTNDAGAITAPLSASCAAVSGPATITLRVLDADGASTDADVTVDVTSNNTPALGGYASTTLAPGSSTTVTPAAPLTDDDMLTPTVTAPGFAGTLGVDGAGVVTIGNASPAGVYTVTVSATDPCALSASQSFILTVNTDPSITPAAAAMRQGETRTLTLATVNDADQSASSLAITQLSAPPGIMIGALTNSNGVISAAVTTSCAATTQTVTLRVTDNRGVTADATTTIDVTSNVPPSLGAYADALLVLGQGTTVVPSTVLSDAVTVTVSAPGFGGTLSVDAASGAVTIGNASPAGVFTATVTATDVCGASTTSVFALTVNTVPAISGLSASIDQGQTAPLTLATVTDADQSASSLNVVAITTPAGITIGSLTNTNGTISASVTASCGATNQTITLRVTDDRGATADAIATINVAANAAASLGTYTATTLTPGSGTFVSPIAPPLDSGTLTMSVSAAGFGGTLAVDNAGVVTIADASPAGVYTVAVTATDNCGLNVSQSFVLTVNTSPTIAPASVSLPQGETRTLTLATTSDADQTAGSLTVSQITAPPGIAIGSLTNLNGTITASVTATCTATAQAVTFRVTDNRGVTADATTTIDVTANVPPLLGTYANTLLDLGQGTTLVPAAMPFDASSIAVSAPGFDGTVAVDATSGVVTIGNASPAGVYTVALTAMDACGASTTSAFTLTVNTAPAITGFTASIDQGQTATLTLATVSDADQGAGLLAVTQLTTPPGIAINSLTNTNGTITASVTATCSASSQPVTFRVSDDRGTTADAVASIEVASNTAPSLGTYTTTTLTPGSTTTVTPTTPPSDNGTVAMSVAAPGFSGSLGVDNAGAVTISNATPAGVYTVTVGATDNCGATTSRSFTLTVNTAPVISGAAVSIEQGQTATLLLATVSDNDQTAGSLTVTQITTPSGVTVGPLTNTNGLITAPVTAVCAAATQSVTLRVTDIRGVSADATTTIGVTPNLPPTLGTYADSVVNLGEGITVLPVAAPRPDPSSSLTASAPGFTGSISTDAVTGAVTVATAGPEGRYAVTVTATDSCGASTTRTFTLVVNVRPAIEVHPGVTIQAGGFLTVLVATVGDGEEEAGDLHVDVVSAPAGLTIEALTNRGGAISAAVSASCAMSGPVSLTLEVRDSNGARAAVEVPVNVTPNSAPRLGVYPSVQLRPGQETTVSAAHAHADNGTMQFGVSAVDFPGEVSIDATGTVTIKGAGPSRDYTVTVTATDNCGAASAATFTLKVAGTGRRRAVRH